MKKFIFSAVMMMFAVIAYAQQTTVEGSRIFDNTSVSVYAGGMSWVNPNVSNSDDFLKGIRPSVGVSVGKWFTPVVGADVFYETSVNSFPFNKNLSRWTAFDFMNLGINGRVNLNNLIHKYGGEPDFFEAVPFAGIGWGHGFTNSSGSNISNSGTALPVKDHTTNYLTANMGAVLNFNVSEAWQINLRPAISYMLTGSGIQTEFNSNRSYVSLMAGVTYKFGHKTSTGRKTRNFTKAYTVAEYESLQKKFDDLQDAFNNVPKEVEVEKIVEKVVEKEVPVEVVKNAVTDPHFLQGLAKVDVTSESVLTALAEEMKSNSDGYVLTGYASTEGDDVYNQNLSLKRAEAVKKYLVSQGVDSSRLETVAGGKTDKFGDDPAANRRVTVVKK